MRHPRPTETIPPIPPYNPRTPKIDQPASITICAEDDILVFNIAVDDPTHVEECHGVGDLTEIAPDEVLGESQQVLLDKVEQVLWGRREESCVCICVGNRVQGGQRGR